MLDFSEEQKPEQLPLPLDKLKQPTRTIGDVPEKEYFLDQIRNAVRLSSTTGQSEENINTQQEFLKSFSQNLKSMNVELLADLKSDEKDVLEQTLKAITDLQTDTNEKFEKSILRLVKIGEGLVIFTLIPIEESNIIRTSCNSLQVIYSFTYIKCNRVILHCFLII